MDPNDRPVKQVIIMRRDLKMRRGKEVAQGSHASMAWLSKRYMALEELASHVIMDRLNINLLSPAERQWLSGNFTKITLQVKDLVEMAEIMGRAKAAGLMVELITDCGATEFHGVATETCCAIGPDYANKIDPITKGLQLY